MRSFNRPKGDLTNLILLERILFLILSAVGLATAVVSLTPNVSTEYRNYFITQTSDCYPRPVDGRHVLNKSMDLKSGSEWPRHLIVCGATAPETNGTWTIGLKAEFLLKPLPVQSYVLILGISDAFIVEPSDYQRVVVRANGSTLGSSKLDHPREQELSFDVPAKFITSGKGALRVELNLPDARRGKTRREPRSLGIKLATITLNSQASSNSRTHDIDTQ